MSRPSTTSADHYFCALLFHLLTVKEHAFCCKPVVELFWSRGLPDISTASVVTTAL